MKIRLLLIFLAIGMGIHAQDKVQRNRLFDKDWRFTKDSITNGQNADLNDLQ